LAWSGTGSFTATASKIEPTGGRSVDLAFADPPFNIGYEYDAYHDNHKDEHYLAWTKLWGEQIHRVLKPTDILAGDRRRVRGRTQNPVSERPRLHLPQLGDLVLHLRVNCQKKFSRSHTHLFHFVKHKKQFTFNNTDPAVRVPSARSWFTPTYGRNSAGRLPDDTWILRPQTCPTASNPTRTRGTSAASAARSRSGRLARLPDARTTPRPHHPRFVLIPTIWYSTRSAAAARAGGSEETRPPLRRFRAVAELRAASAGATGRGGGRAAARRRGGPKLSAADHAARPAAAPSRNDDAGVMGDA